MAKENERGSEEKPKRAARWIPQSSELRYLKRFNAWGKQGGLAEYAKEYAKRGADPKANADRAESVAAPQYNGHSEDPVEERLYRPRKKRAEALYSKDDA